MTPMSYPQDPSVRLTATLRSKRRRTYALMGVLAAATLLLAGLVVWRTSAEYAGVRALPPANEYVVFFSEELTVAEQLARLQRHPGAEYVQAGKLPGVVVVRLSGDVAAGVQALRQDSAVFQVQKSVVGMICH